MQQLPHKRLCHRLLLPLLPHLLQLKTRDSQVTTLASEREQLNINAGCISFRACISNSDCGFMSVSPAAVAVSAARATPFRTLH